MRGGTLIGPCIIAGRLAKLEALGRMRLRRTAEGTVSRVDGSPSLSVAKTGVP